jgi:hypothetical protein
MGAAISTFYSDGINDIFVGHNRDAALKFAKDISGGLLEHLVELLEKRRSGSEEALSIIAGAITKLSPNG